MAADGREDPAGPGPDGEPAGRPGDPPFADREAVLGELEDLAQFQALLEPRGTRGLVVGCPDCAEPHYLGWELLRANLRTVLDLGRPGAHEPAYRPDPARYVSWDYARGFADGVLDADPDADGVAGPEDGWDDGPVR